MYCNDKKEVYRRMYVIRKTEETVLEAFKKGFMKGTAHLCIGQEAVSVGVCSCLEKEDAVFSNHRGHGHMVAKGVDPEKFLAELMGLDSGLCAGLGGSQHIVDTSVGFMGSNGITGGAVPVAVGYALSQKLSGSDNITVVFLGDGATSQGAVHEAMNLASVFKAPIIFVCENNKYAMSSPADKFVSGSLVSRAEAYGIISWSVDGMSEKSVEIAAYWARKAALKGKPSFIEAKTYRFCGHSKSDMELYRKKQEVKEWRLVDPIFSDLPDGLLLSIEDKAIIRKEVDSEFEDIKKRLGI